MTLFAAKEQSNLRI